MPCHCCFALVVPLRYTRSPESCPAHHHSSSIISTGTPIPLAQNIAPLPVVATAIARRCRRVQTGHVRDRGGGRAPDGSAGIFGRKAHPVPLQTAGVGSVEMICGDCAERTHGLHAFKYIIMDPDRVVCCCRTCCTLCFLFLAKPF